MGGLFGGRPQQQASSTVSQPQLPAYLQPYMTEAAGKAQSLYGSGQLAPSYFPGSTVASPSAATSQAQQMITQRAQQGSPLNPAATQAYLSTIQGDFLNPESNPFLRGAMDAANRGTVQQFSEAVLPGLTSSFSKAGRSSSQAYGNTIGRAAEGLSRTLSDSNATMAYQNLNDERARQMNAATNAGQVAAADYFDANQLQNVGNIQDALAQDQINADIDKYNYNANLPQNALQNYINLLNGTAGSVGSGSISTGVQYGGQTRTAQTLGNLATAAALFSDKRLKKNIRKIGVKKGLNVYSYNYLWGQKSVGYMADEVEKLYPHAVMADKSGYKRVNYGAI